ncbi:GTPase domain-containing protein [Sanguibacter suaedae]|uniref:50S ribosome-binding GTPase n=1 Tax=Sanguibacter suaedae TaxID=2795737 RepID=A0A934IBZ9_9MICO|nr:GTPase domain-containing protein [Sanguibacter suaedae]MBI9115071.1 50S ribosome-binding GTPase [Sanguibacter suaedae]
MSTLSGPEAHQPIAGRHSADGAEALEPHSTVFDVVTDLRREVAGLSFPLEIDEVDVARARQQRLVAQLDDHLLPRLKQLSTPAVVVIAGSTGAGKSTLINSLLREEVSQASVIRPTTREPVLAFNPLDAEVLAGTALVDSIRSVPNEHVPRGIVLLDAPDLDSVLDENRQTAERLLEGADLWLFVTTAARYGDALPWRTLEGAMERGATVAMVLNRAPQASLTTVRGDLLARLREHGMDNAPLFVVPDAGPHEGLLPAASVVAIDRWLRTLGGADRARTVILRTLRGSLGALPPWVEELAEHVDAQHLAATRLEAAAGAELPPVATTARRLVESGALAEGAVESRWAQLVRPARLDKAISRSGVARGSARVGRNREAALADLVAAVRDAAVAGLTSAADDAHAALREALARQPGGADLLGPGKGEAGRAAAAADAVDAWIAATRDRAGAVDPASGKQAESAVRAFGHGGLAALLLAAGLGLAAAEDLVGRLLGNDGRDLVPVVTGDLAERTATLVDRELDPAREALAVPALADDAAVGLRVRLAEMSQLA